MRIRFTHHRMKRIPSNSIQGAFRLPHICTTKTVVRARNGWRQHMGRKFQCFQLLGMLSVVPPCRDHVILSHILSLLNCFIQIPFLSFYILLTNCNIIPVTATMVSRYFHLLKEMLVHLLYFCCSLSKPTTAKPDQTKARSWELNPVVSPLEASPWPPRSEVRNRSQVGNPHTTIWSVNVLASIFIIRLNAYPYFN